MKNNNYLTEALFISLITFLLGSQSILAQSQKGADIGGGGWSNFFVSLNSDGNTVAIGSPGDPGIWGSPGYVLVYNWSGSAWVNTGNILGENNDDRSGFSVSLSSDGNTVAIGALNNDGIGNNAGHVRVYNWSGSDWIQKGTDIDGEAADDYSGWSVSLSSDGNTVAIGAPQNAAGEAKVGLVRIYSWSGNAWIQKGIDINGEAAADYSGKSVSLNSDGNTVVIGAGENDGHEINAGHARVFNWSGSAWIQKGIDIDGKASNDQSGASVSLSSDGNTVAIGAHTGGYVRVFSLPSVGIVTNVTPNSGKNTQATAVTITGLNFAGATAVRLDDASATKLTGTISVNGSGTQITGLSVPQGIASGGAYNVIVTTPAGSNDTSAMKFTVTALPVVATIDPDSGLITQTTAVTITGQNFSEASSASLSDPSATRLTGTLTVNGSGTQITGLRVPSGIQTGRYNVIVTTPVGNNDTSVVKYTVTALPVVTDIIPDSGNTLQTTQVTIVGQYFGDVSEVRLNDGQTTKLVGVPVVNAAKTTITGLSVPPGVAVEKYNVIATTPIGKNTQSAKKFTVYFKEDAGITDEKRERHVFLLQSYPNPFTSNAIISYSLPSSSDVRLTIHDYLGRGISELVNEKQNAGGHEISFDAKNISAGVYVYRLQVGGYVESRMMNVLK